MLTQLQWESFALTPLPAYGPGATATKPAIQILCCYLSEWSLWPPSMGFFEIKPLNFSISGGSVRTVSVACYLRLFSPAQAT